MKPQGNDKRDGSILTQLGTLAIALLAVAALVNGIFTWRFGADNYMKSLKSTSSSVLAQARSGMEAYACLPWLLDFWEGHADEMDLDGDAQERTADVASLLAKLGVSDMHEVSVAQAKGLSSTERLHLAEQCYLDMHRYYSDLKRNFGPQTLYCAAYAGKDEAVPFVQGVDEGTKTANGSPYYALGEKWPFNPTLHPALQELERDGGDKPRFETVTSTVDDVEYLLGYMPVIVDGTARCHICVSYTTAELREDILGNLRVIEVTNAVIMVVSTALLLWAGRSFLNKLALVQGEVRAYQRTKDTDAIARGLQAIHANNEVGRLADDISEMAVELDRHAKQTARLSAERQRIDTELELAARIQRTSLPTVFPPFPERREFGLFASMDAAKEVGGDFYDFFPLSKDELAVIVADVSGKGVPAALFMMRAKAAIKDLLISGLALEEAVARANNELCVGNDEFMFVTAWLGVLDLQTGVMEFVHAGHTCSVLLRGDTATFVNEKRDPCLGAFPDVPFTRQTLSLEPSDALFLYSDGVTEAFSATDEMYGSEGLERVLLKAEVATTDKANEYCEKVCRVVRDDLKEFAKGCEQSDDITMLCVRYEGLSEA